MSRVNVALGQLFAYVRTASENVICDNIYLTLDISSFDIWAVVVLAYAVFNLCIIGLLLVRFL